MSIKAKTLLLIAFAFAIISCSTTRECCVGPPGLTDTWQQYEYGYSPGAGYFIEEVPAVPLKYIKLKDNYHFESNIESLENFFFFKVFPDSLSSMDILSLYETKPGNSSQISDHSYNIEFTNEGNLKLYYRYCIEGCHLGFKPIDIDD